MKSPYSIPSLVSANIINPKIVVTPTAIAIKNTIAFASLLNESSYLYVPYHLIKKLTVTFLTLQTSFFERMMNYSLVIAVNTI
jgi:hypothetical protein